MEPSSMPVSLSMASASQLVTQTRVAPSKPSANAVVNPMFTNAGAVLLQSCQAPSRPAAICEPLGQAWRGAAAKSSSEAALFGVLAVWTAACQPQGELHEAPALRAGSRGRCGGRSLCVAGTRRRGQVSRLPSDAAVGPSGSWTSGWSLPGRTLVPSGQLAGGRSPLPGPGAVRHSHVRGQDLAVANRRAVRALHVREADGQRDDVPMGGIAGNGDERGDNLSLKTGGGS